MRWRGKIRGLQRRFALGAAGARLRRFRTNASASCITATRFATRNLSQHVAKPILAGDEQRLVSAEARGPLLRSSSRPSWRVYCTVSGRVSGNARRLPGFSRTPSAGCAGPSRTVARLAAVAVTAGALLASFGTAKASAIGVEPGSFSYKLHETIPLLEVEDWSPEARLFADAKKLLNTLPITQAGAHADATVTWVLKVPGGEGAVRGGSEVTSDIVVKGPLGIFANLNAVPACPLSTFKYTVNVVPELSCDPASQIGVVSALFGGAIPDRTYPIYKVSTLPGALATFGYAYEIGLGRFGVFVNAKLRTNEDYGITLERVGTKLPEFIPASFMTFWGVPADPSYDSERWNRSPFTWGAPAGIPPAPVLANSANCDSEVLEATLRLRYLREEPEHWLPDDPEDPAYRFASPGPVGCDQLTFQPQATLSASTDISDSSSGISLHMEFPQANDPSDLGTPPLKDAEINLPSGISVNPAAANGVAGCDPSQIGFLGADFPLPNPIRFSLGAARCPDASKIGTAVLESPLVEEPVRGDVYLATPYDNPFNSLFALYLVLNGPSVSDLDPNFTIKLAAQVAVDSNTGQISAKIDSLPQLASESIKVRLLGGPAPPVTTPLTCGEEIARVRLVPWSAPESGPPALVESPMIFNSGSSGVPCLQSASSRPFSPALAIRTRNASASAYSPVILHVSKPQGDQGLSALNIRLPRGLTANLKGVTYCSPAGIAQAEARDAAGEGLIEQTHASCPADSKVGSVLASIGGGSMPLSVPGKVYLAGPYKDAPFSLVVITPALAGGTEDDPLFDLGVIVERVAIRVDPRSGQITIGSEPMPRIFGGVPLRINGLTIRLDRDGFIRNPSNCSELKATADVKGANGGQSRLSARFQVDGCGSLRFRPRIQVKLLGGTSEGQHPKLKAVFNAERNDATLARTRITLPKTERLNFDRLAARCSESLFAQGRCPRRSAVGHATAWSPLFDRPFNGRVYLKSSGHGRPVLALSFEGEVFGEAVAELRVRRDRRVQLAFANLPDIPLDGVKLVLQGGKEGLLTNSRSLCSRPNPFGIRFTSHDGRLRSQRTYGVSKCSGGKQLRRKRGPANR
jgi:hypothetical protein